MGTTKHTRKSKRTLYWFDQWGNQRKANWLERLWHWLFH